MIERATRHASRATPLLTLARDLQRRKGRERRALFVAEGVRAVEELVRAKLEIRGALVSPQLGESPRGRSLRHALDSRGVEVADVTPKELASAADTDTPQGVLAIAEVPAYSLDQARVVDGSRVLVLDAVQDPGNVGTILRTAAALGAVVTVALPGTVDIWNPKVVRGAMGAHFHHTTLHAEPDELFAFLNREGTELWGADANGTPLHDLKAPSRLAIAVGNEGSGLTAAVRARVAQRVALPIASRVESLNVAVAAGILLFALRGTH